MNSKSKKWAVGLSLLAACTAGTLSASAQTFDTPPSDFQLLPPQNSRPSPFGSAPTTLNVGNFDSSVKSTITGANLNDIAVTGVPGISGIASGPGGTFTHRIWTIVHDSGSDTRSLTQTSPSDIVVIPDSEDDLFYLFPSSLEILDLNGDGQNDLALADSPSFGFSNDKPNTPARIIGIPGQASAPFFATSLNLLGQQRDSASLPGPFIIGGFSQPVLAAGDFDGDGATDLAFYDFDGALDNDLAAVLVNNGTVGILPKSETILQTPSDIGKDNDGYNVAAADINGDGITDLAMTFVRPSDDEPGPGRVLAFLGNGDGTFNGEPVVNVLISDQAELHGLVIGDFDGNSFLDFAVSNFTNSDISVGGTQVTVVLCSPGSPAACNVNPITLNLTIAANLASADFDSDGLDDLALTQFGCASDQCNDQSQIIGNVGVFLNRGSDFEDVADQTLPLGGTEVRQLVNQVIAKDIDGCGGPDLAYIGTQFPEDDDDVVVVEPAIKLAEFQDEVKFGVFGGTSYASVAFNANEAPVADAGEGTLTPGGVLVGGEPTCADPSDDTQAILWTVLSGTATISDPTAANPVITNASAGAVLQVTCTDACGLSDTDTVTISAPALLEGAGCSLGLVTVAGPSAAWVLGLVGLVPMLALRRRSR